MEIKLINVRSLIRKRLLLMIMRTFIFLLCTTVFSFNTKSSLAQEKITIDVDKVATIDEVFEIIIDQTKYRFLYPEGLFKNVPKVQLKKGTIRVDKLLNQSLGAGKFNVIVSENNTIIIKDSRNQDPIQVIGKVVDEAGLPVPGATVMIKGTNIGVATDFDGSYTILVPSSENVLIFSALGFATQEIIVGNQTKINIVLKERADKLGEVVINAGYYTTIKKESTGSIGKVSAAEIDKKPINNPLSALQGTVTGVDVIENSGVPGGGFKVRIRGQNSLMAGNEPLYIIDGVPYDTQSLASGSTSGGIIPYADVNPLNAINPSAIESIEILKDADATAIYGSRGANGVVLITTKRGKEGKTEIIVSSSTGIASVTRKVDLLNTQQYLEMRQEAFANDNITPQPWDYDLTQWDANRYTDWQKELIGGTANTRKIFAQASGGSSNTQFLISGQSQEETTVFPGKFGYERLNVNTNINHKGNDERFKILFTAGYTLEKNKLPYLDFTYDAQNLSPNSPPIYDEEGNLNWENGTWTNPLAQIGSEYNQNSKSLISNTVLTYFFSNNFEFKINVGYGFSQLKGKNTNPNTIYNPAYGLDSQYSSLITSEGNRTYWITEPQIRWEKKRGNNKWDVLIGTTFQEHNYEQGSIMGYGFPTNNFINNLSAANTITILEESENQYKYHSIFARINYSFRNKLFINGTGRRDGSSRFGTNNKYGNFGAIGLAWRFTEGNKISWLNSGKIRGSYGLAGNDQIGDYQYLQTYTIQDYPYDGNIGLVPSHLYNPNFKWEKITKREVAVDLEFLNSKIALSLAYYNNHSSNQLVNYALPGTTGFTSIQSNLGAKVENSGFEIELNGKIAQNENFSWNSSFNLSVPRNKLLAFPGLENSTYANRYVIGEPLSIAKLYELQGVNPDTGIFEFTDFNGDGIINSNDKQKIADLSPKFFGGLSNSIIYKNWSLDFLFQFVKKNGYNQYRFSNPPGVMLNQPASVLDRWQQPGDIASMQRFTTGKNYEAYLAYSKFTQSNGIISDASFIRLRSLELAYNLQLGTNGASCRIYLQGLNLLTFSSFEGGDPEQTVRFLAPLKRISVGAKLHL